MTSKDKGKIHHSMYWRTVLVIYLSTCVFAKVDYTGHQVLGISPTSERAAKILYKLIEDETLDLDPWTEAAQDRVIPVRVPPTSMAKLRRHLDIHNIAYQVVVPDVQKLIDQEAASIHGNPARYVGNSFPRRFKRSSRPTAPPRHIVDQTLNVLFNTISTFSSHQIINDWIDSMAELQPDIASTEVIGNSTENRPLKLIKIGRPREDGLPKKIIFIDALIHAREWVTQSTALYMIFQLMSLHGKDPEITSLMDTFDWHILPVLNPDGYEHSHTDRLWRKTRSYHRPDRPRKPSCIGVDANRNFQYHWRPAIGHCQQFYSGPRPFSEPETDAMAKYILRRKENIIMYLSLHSPIQIWLTPWGHTAKEPHDHADINRVAQAAAHAMESMHGVSFLAGPIYSFLRYPVHGSSIDWAKGEAGIKYSFAPELRGNSNKSNYLSRSFFIPRDKLIPAGEETWAAVKAAAKEIMIIDNIKPYVRGGSVLNEEDQLDAVVKNLPLGDVDGLSQNTDLIENANASAASRLKGLEVASGQPESSSSFMNPEARRTDQSGMMAHQKATSHQPSTNQETRSPQDVIDLLLEKQGSSHVGQVEPASFQPVTQQPVLAAAQVRDGSILSDDDVDELVDGETAAVSDGELSEFTPARAPRPVTI